MDLAAVAGHDVDQAVLVACLRGNTTSPRPGDEIRLAAVTRWQRLDGFLATMPPERVGFSTDLVEHLAFARDATEQRWARLDQALDALLTAWIDAGLATTLLKGAAIVRDGILPAGDRPMADLDVLMSRDEVEAAHAAARALGFRSTVTSAQWHHARTRHHHLPALVDDDGVHVEVHHRLLDHSHPCRRLDDACRERTVDIADTGVGRLDDAAMWLHLAVHTWDDRRRGTGGALLQLRDLDRLLARTDCAEVASIATAARAGHLIGTMAAVLDEVIPSTGAAELRRRLGGPDGDDPHLQAFLRQRVLGRRGPLAQLVHPTANVAYTPWRLLTRARRQVWPPVEQIQRVLGPGGRRRDHLASLVPVARDAIALPRATWRDVRLDRWAHDLTIHPGRRDGDDVPRIASGPGPGTPLRTEK